ncbi:MAG: hypothetical protein ACLQFR_14680 [Streptosporangiaceae bacterium]
MCAELTYAQHAMSRFAAARFGVAGRHGERGPSAPSPIEALDLLHRWLSAPPDLPVPSLSWGSWPGRHLERARPSARAHRRE